MRRVIVPIAAVLCLVPFTDLLHARQGPPGADKKEEALKRLDQLAKELDQLEQQISEERIKARKDLVEKEQRVRLLDRAFTVQTQQLTTELRSLEKQLADFQRVTPGTEPNPLVGALKKKIDELHAEQERQLLQTGVVREEFMVAEEKFRYLERKHDNQRRFLNLKIELVEQELFGKSEGVDRRKMEKLEKTLESIQRDLEELRRKGESKDKEL